MVEPGQRVALVGATGSGKSTLLALIARLYDVSGGSVRVDGHDVRSYTLASLREQVSFVLQDVVLFHTSIAETSPTAGLTRPRKRFGARAGSRRPMNSIIRDTPILLLDEPSAALDPESEDLIFRGLSRHLDGRTSITIAHRLATVRHADVIFVLHQGSIAECGTHEELLARDGRYARFHRIQFRARRRARELMRPAPCRFCIVADRPSRYPAIMNKHSDTRAHAAVATMPVMVATPPASAVSPADELARRVRGEYLEMPGLALTLGQAQRMWNLRRGECERLLGDLVNAGFLACTPLGMFVRADSGRAGA